MKLIRPLVLLLTCLLGTLSASHVAAAPQEKPEASVPAKAPTAAKKPAVKKASVSSKPVAKKAAPAKKRPPIASKSKSAREVAKTKLKSAKLDLSLPPELVKELSPKGAVPLPKHEPLLPPMFGEKPAPESPFQLNGRLLSNEMNLQLRNESRQDIEGAAIDFEFKQ